MIDRTPETYAYARAPRPEETDVPLAEAYLTAVARVEALPRNQSGEDKTWVENAIRESEAHFAKAVRVR